jgi:hypothetical protein
MVREVLAGNDGKMDEREQEKRTGDESRKTAGTTKSRTVERTSRGKTSGKDGAERLRQAADKRVGQNSEGLADLLTKKALGGDLASAKVLVGLAERKKPKPERKKTRRGPSLAQQLAAEPEWTGEEDEGIGNREQGTENVARSDRNSGR